MPANTFAKPAFRFTGWHMFAILAAFFGVVIVVNVYMARLATGTFSGEIVTNSYEASQHYNQWLDEAAREKALGWTVDVTRMADGRVSVRIVGKGQTPVPSKGVLSGEAWHPLGRVADRSVSFVAQADGSYRSFDPLPDGRWNLRLRLEGDGHVWRGQEAI
jgi:nitrogen fixation protein FixH